MTDQKTIDWRERIFQELRLIGQARKATKGKKKLVPAYQAISGETMPPTEDEIDGYDVRAMLSADVAKIKDETTRYVVRIVQKAHYMGRLTCPVCSDRPILGRGEM